MIKMSFCILSYALKFSLLIKIFDVRQKKSFLKIINLKLFKKITLIFLSLVSIINDFHNDETITITF
jgi:hypothetical protein